MACRVYLWFKGYPIKDCLQRLERVNAPMKPKLCCECKRPILSPKTLQKVCGLACAISYSQKQSAKKEAKDAQIKRKEYREAKVKCKSRGQWLKEAQTAFNTFIRHRDAGLPCISCGSHTGKKNAGHYRSVGSCPELRFEPLQVWLQCEKCNSYLSGNLINYRIELIKRIGVAKVEWIEGPQQPAKWTIEELKQITKEYKEKLKCIKSN